MTSLAVLVSLMIGCATGVAVRDLVPPARARGANPVVYEYKVVQSKFAWDASSVEETAKKFGKEGWRLVHAIPRDNYLLLTFESAHAM